MKRRVFLSTLSAAGPVAFFSTSNAEAQLEGGIDELVREVGFALKIPLDKAVGATGALLHIAREQLRTAEFAEISAFLSGTERLIQQAGNVIKTALPTSIGEMGVALQSMGLPAESADELRRFLLDHLRRRGGRKIVGLLQKAWAQK